MTFREEKILSLASISTASAQDLDLLRKQFKQVLKSGMHGLCFSPYEEGQNPGYTLTEEQIRRRMSIIAPYTKWIRSFSCTEGNELIPVIAKEFGLKTMVGAWLGTDEAINKAEMEGLIKLSSEGHVDIAAVGNEVMYRGDLSEDELIAHMMEFKKAVPNVEMGYVDAYYEFTDHPRITEACDVILSNCYPYWEACHHDYSLVYMKEMFNQALRAANGKRVIITETGWPSKGEGLRGALPSEANAMAYFINSQIWSKQDDIEMFYFSSFDESWKVGAEGDVGAYWGIWDKDEKLKYGI